MLSGFECEGLQNKKRCKRCLVTKPLSEFNRHPKTRDGRQPQCKVCCNEYSKENYEKNRERIKICGRAWVAKNRERYRILSYNHRLAKKYGMTRGDYDRLLSSQGGRCAICGPLGVEPSEKLCVDHDHETGMVRGILCASCNSGLGHFKDRKEALSAAIIYLKISRKA